MAKKVLKIEVGGAIFTRKTDHNYSHVVVVRRSNLNKEVAASYTTPYGEQFCGKEYALNWGNGEGEKHICSIYSPRQDDPALDAGCREKAKKAFPGRRITVVETELFGSGMSMREKELGFQMGEYGLTHCPIHQHQKYSYKVFTYYAEKMGPENTPHNFYVSSWHTRKDLAEREASKLRLLVDNFGEGIYDLVEVVEIPAQ